MTKQDFINSIFNGRLAILKRPVGVSDGPTVNYDPYDFIESYARPMMEGVYDRLSANVPPGPSSISYPFSSVPDGMEVPPKPIFYQDIDPVNLIEAGDGEIYKNGSLFKTISSTSRSKIGIVFRDGDDFYFIKCPIPEPFDFSGSGAISFAVSSPKNNWYFSKLWTSYLEGLKTKYLAIYAIADFFGIPKPDTFDVFGSVTCELAVDPSPYSLTVNLNRHFFIPYCSYGSGKDWYDAEVAEAASVVNHTFTGQLKNMFSLLDSLIERASVPTTVMVGLVADKLSPLFPPMIDGAFSLFQAPSPYSLTGVPTENIAYLTSGYLPNGLDPASVFAMILTGGMSMKFKAIGYPTATIDKISLRNFIETYQEDLAKGSFLAQKYQSYYAIQLGYSMALDALYKNTVDVAMFKSSHEWSRINE